MLFAHRIRYRMIDVYRRWRNKVAEAPRTVKWAYQRVSRGWDDRAIWAIDDHLCRQLGEQMVTLAETTICDRGSTWEVDCKLHGEALQHYAKTHYELSPTALDPVYASAQEALRWVADNLGSLWD